MTLTELILKGNLDCLRRDQLNVIKAAALAEFADAIDECLDPARVRLDLASDDHLRNVDGLYKVRGALKALAYQDRQAKREANGQPARRRSPAETRRLRRVIISA